MVQSFLSVGLSPSSGGAQKESVSWRRTGIVRPAPASCVPQPSGLRFGRKLMILLSCSSCHAFSLYKAGRPAGPDFLFLSSRTRLNIWELMTEPIFHATLTTEVRFWSSELAPCTLKSAEWMFVSGTNPCWAELTLSDVTLSFMKRFLHPLGLYLSSFPQR